MSKLKILGVAALLGLLIVGTVWGDNPDSVVVSWSGGESCWITMTVHADVFLGTITGVGQVLPSTGNTISINNNCTNGISLTVEPTAVTDPYDTTSDGVLPNGASVFDDFEWKASNASSGFTIAPGKDSYTTFSGLNDDQDVGSSSNPANITVDIDYRYTSDINDVPGDYDVTLEYTATSN